MRDGSENFTRKREENLTRERDDVAEGGQAEGEKAEGAEEDNEASVAGRSHQSGDAGHGVMLADGGGGGDGKRLTTQKKKRLEATRTWTAQRLTRQMAQDKQRLADTALAMAQGHQKSQNFQKEPTVAQHATSSSPGSSTSHPTATATSLMRSSAPPPAMTSGGDDDVKTEALRRCRVKDAKRRGEEAAARAALWQVRAEFAQRLRLDEHLSTRRQVADLYNWRTLQTHRVMRSVEENARVSKLARRQRADAWQVFADLTSPRVPLGSSVCSLATARSDHTITCDIDASVAQDGYDAIGDDQMERSQRKATAAVPVFPRASR
jgi:hypothetical protein